MKAAFALFAAAMLVQPLSAKDKAPDAPDWKCDVEVKESDQWWQVDNFSARWTYWTQSRATIGLTAYTYTEHNLHHLFEEGAFTRWGGSNFIVSPRTAKTRGKMWAQVSSGGRTLEPKEVTRSGGFYGVAIFPAHEVEALMDDAPELSVTFYRKNSEIFEQITVPTEVIRKGAAKLVPQAREYQERMAAPNDDICDDQNDIIIM